MQEERERDHVKYVFPETLGQFSSQLARRTPELIRL
jgi:hypothetical protein